MITIVISMLCIVYLLYYVNKNKEKEMDAEGIEQECIIADNM